MSNIQRNLTRILRKLFTLFAKDLAARKVYASQLGFFLDGWADLIEGMGSKAEDIRLEVWRQLKDRNMPDVTVDFARIIEGITSSDERMNYSITSTFPGVTITIYVASHGNDLFASWRTFIRPTINKGLIEAYAGIAFLAVLFRGLFNDQSYSAIYHLDYTSLDTYWASIQRLLVVLFPLVGLFIAIFLFILFIAAIAGILLKRNILAFILKEPSLFDQEDITAMSLTVHKTLLHTLDTAGIDMSKLRLKQEFKSGRRGENV